MSAGKRRSRPTRMQANGLCLLSAMLLTLLRAAEFLWPEGWREGYAGLALGAAPYLAAGIPALAGAVGLRLRGERLRPNAFTPAQALFGLLAASAGLLFADDITLLWCAALEAAGLSAGRALVGIELRTPGMLAASIALCALIPAACDELLFRGELFAAWERRGTGCAILATSALYALLSPSLAEVPARLALGAALGALLARSGSLYLAALCHGAQEAFRVLAAYARGVSADASRWSDLLASLGGARGWWLLALETALLGAVYALTVRSACLLKPRGEAPFHGGPAQCKPMGPAETFVLCAAVVTALACLLSDALGYAGLWGI